jgi:hypothetical protein
MFKNITLSEGVQKRRDFLWFLILLFWGSKCEKITPSEGVQKRKDFLWFLIFRVLQM